MSKALLKTVCAFAATLALVLADQSRTTAADRSDWLSAADFGASGSEFETTAATTAGSNRITVADVGDFKPGQGITVSRCNVHYTTPRLWSGGPPYENSKPLENSVEVCGYDGSKGRWLVFVLDIKPSDSPAFRWTDDLGRTWHAEVPITHDWQPLSAGVEVRLGRRDWQSGYVVSFGARDQLVSTIDRIEGNVLVLHDAANRTTDRAVVRHCDDRAIGAAVDRAVREKRNLLLPGGHYRLSRRIVVKDAAAITIEGGGSALLDISDGEGPCLVLDGGREVTLRNLRMTGFMGFEDRDRAGPLPTRGAAAIWGFFLKHCNAVTIGGTERVLIENCHASRMSGECFVSACLSRRVAATMPRGTPPSNDSPGDADLSLPWVLSPGRPCSISTTYLRCSVTDSARNAFNDVTCGPENTHVLQCRIEDVGGCSWEGASRFVRFIGNHVRNAGTVAIGNLGPPNRDASFDKLGAGQHIVADNVFDGGVCYGGCAVRAAAGATQVIVKNNLFVNYNSSAIEFLGGTGPNHFPTANVSALGNSIDLTTAEGRPTARCGIKVSASDAVVADNQVYVRGQCDRLAAGIRVDEPAMNVIVHDNLVRNCGAGFAAGRVRSGVGRVIDQRTFVRSDNWRSQGLPLVRDDSHGYRGWTLVWLRGDRPDGVSIVESFDRPTRTFRLREPRDMKAGDQFEAFSADGTNWNVHDNTITDCLRPVVLDCYGGPTTVFANNQVSRVSAAGVREAVEVRGRWKLVGNRFQGFDEPAGAVLALYPDRLGRPLANVYRDNIFEQCRLPVREGRDGLWKAAVTGGNLFLDCGTTPPQGSSSSAP